MHTVSVTELRQHLPAWLKKVEAGEEVRVTSRGRVIARLTPERDPQALALERLEALRGTVIVGDILAPIDEPWSADEDHL
ncbi:MAG TPA: type II toxin-antitoxin system prevent-host-death family antitoxin [Rhodocyclaceae bacterium]|nr:type II toxin-antitoxin system prevent-host-death family antitoxin [Rhodocyclaceae bacterium]